MKKWKGKKKTRKKDAEETVSYRSTRADMN